MIAHPTKHTPSQDALFSMTEQMGCIYWELSIHFPCQTKPGVCIFGSWSLFIVCNHSKRNVLLFATDRSSSYDKVLLVMEFCLFMLVNE
jgi:hypothetical protein